MVVVTCVIRDCGSTLYVGMAQGVSFSLYIGIVKAMSVLYICYVHLYSTGMHDAIMNLGSAILLGEYPV